MTPVLDIPYVSAPKNACALACYTMTAKYFFPEVTFNQISKISGWTPDYVVWPFKFWKWIMDKEIKITDYDLIDYDGWAGGGFSILEKSISKKELNWLKNNSKDLGTVGMDLKAVLDHKNFTYHRVKPTLEKLVESVYKGSVCEVVLDSRTLDRRDGFSLHRVVVTSLTDNEITFHDPRENPLPHRKELIDHFTKSWLTAVSDPELCIYSK